MPTVLFTMTYTAAGGPVRDASHVCLKVCFQRQRGDGGGDAWTRELRIEARRGERSRGRVCAGDNLESQISRDHQSFCVDCDQRVLVDALYLRASGAARAALRGWLPYHARPFILLVAFIYGGPRCVIYEAIRDSPHLVCDVSNCDRLPQRAARLGLCLPSPTEGKRKRAARAARALARCAARANDGRWPPR